MFVNRINVGKWREKIAMVHICNACARCSVPYGINYASHVQIESVCTIRDDFVLTKTATKTLECCSSKRLCIEDNRIQWLNLTYLSLIDGIVIGPCRTYTIISIPFINQMQTNTPQIEKLSSPSFPLYLSLSMFVYLFFTQHRRHQQKLDLSRAVAPEK